MSEVFDYDLQRELERYNNKKCSNCGYVGEKWEWEDNVSECPICHYEEENTNYEYNPDEK